jgi:hypothetical protein
MVNDDQRNRKRQDEKREDEARQRKLKQNQEKRDDALRDKRREQIENVEDSPYGYVLMDTDDNEVEENPLDQENAPNSIYIGTDSEGVSEDISEYTSDAQVLEDFSERQQTTAGGDELLDRLQEHHSKNPELSGEDVDANWEAADVSGEETVGGTTPTPDQDVVEELGDALGIEYDQEEPLHTYDKLRDRDRNRWELNPASAEEESEAEEEQEQE